ncbi:hypothetical protein KC992_00105 [Candidatus Saccharibacteria bacterium]|nr:hypothetical protein [Candidatus Saccharibacteria bacterium]
MDEAPAPVDDDAVEETLDVVIEVPKPAEEVADKIDEPAEIPAPEPIEVEQQNDSSPTPVIEPPEPSKEPIPSSDVLTSTEGQSERSEGQKSTTGPTPQVSDIKPQLSTDDIVAGLTDDQLKAAASLWAKRSQQKFSALGVAKRKETMELNLRAIVDYLSHHNGSPLPRIARHVNVTPGTTSKYLVQLVSAGKVRAEGWGKNRRHYLK